MFHDPKTNVADLTSFSHTGESTIAYIREITAEDIASKFDNIPDLQSGMSYWAMFAEDGTPLMLAGNKDDLTNTAYYNELTAILPN